jgi:hypothetical protein
MTAILTLLLGAIVGSLGGLYVQGQRQARDELHWLRDRMLEAADAYATAATRVVAEIGVKKMLDMNDQDEVRAQISAHNIASTEAAARLPRVDLIFGTNSPVAQAARAELRQLQVIRSALQTAVHTTGSEFEAKVDDWVARQNELAPLQTKFRDEAQAAIARPSWPLPS